MFRGGGDLPYCEELVKKLKTVMPKGATLLVAATIALLQQASPIA